MNLIIVCILLALDVTQSMYWFPEDCQDILDDGLDDESGVHTIYPGVELEAAVDVYCDQETDGGGWTVFQRRMDGSVDFYRNWDDYQNGFGSASGEYWLGLDVLAVITNSKNYTLRVDLESFENEKKYAEYGTFVVGPESTSYKLTVGSYSGTSGDSLEYSNEQKFSTKDQDNDAYSSGSCAERYKGAWWYKVCHHSNLNGKYFPKGSAASYADGVVWRNWKGYRYSMKKSEMKIRPRK